jgi:hypothetical protein
MRDHQEIADKVAKDIDKLQKKYNCSLGVWLTWRDMEGNLSKMRETPGFDEAEFGIQIRFKDESEN